MRADAVVTEPCLYQTPTPTDGRITATEETDVTSKGGGVQGSTFVGINKRKTLLAEALDECAVEIASLKYTAAVNSDRPGKKCRVPRGFPAILRRAALRQPVTCGEGLVLANSMIEGTEAKVRLMDWKRNNL
jgi:hypothetical protein